MRRLTLVALLFANLLVALQALRHDWGYYETVLIYWCEALVIGGYNVLRLLVVGFVGEQPLGEAVSRQVEFSPGFRILATLAGTAFFAFKFGMFALIVGVLVVALPAFSEPDGSGGRQVFRALSAAGPAVGVAVVALVLSHGLSFVRNFLWRREYQRMSLLGLIVWPYVRMGLVMVVLAVGLILVSLLRGLAKAVADLVSHSVEHSWIAERPPPLPAGVREPAG